MKKIAIGLMSALLVLIVAMVAMAGTIRVPNDYTTIQEAIGAANDGDVILVSPGTYPGDITVNKSVKIKGAGAPTTFISASANTDGFRVIASNVTISRFTISGATGWQKSGVLIGGMFPGDETYLGSVNNVTVRNCTLETNNAGIYIWKSSYNTIANNVVRYNATDPPNLNGGNGIIAWEGPSTDNRITNNKLYENDKYGIFVGGETEADYSGTKITGNNLVRNGDYSAIGGGGWNWLGMGFYNALGVIKVHGNQIYPTGSGLDVWEWNCPDLEVKGSPVWHSDEPRVPTPLE